MDNKSLDIFAVSKEFGLNIRTIRYDIDEIGHFIYNAVGHKRIRIKKNIAHLEVSNNECRVISDNLYKSNFYNIKLSAQERMIMIIFDLCWNNKIITIKELSQRYVVSRATINSDIVNIKDWCARNSIKFISLKGNGIQIKSEPDEHIKNLSKIVRLYENSKLLSDGTIFKNEIFAQWFPDINISKIQTAIKEAEKKYNYWLTDLAFETMAIHIAMSVKRYNNAIEMPIVKFNKKINKNSVRYKMAKFIIENINSELDINLDNSEIYYVSIHIGAKVSSKAENTPERFSIESYITLDLMQKVSQKYNYDFKNNSKLYLSLLQHIKACKIRSENDINILNPLKNELINDYPVLYHCVAQSINEIDSSFIIKSPDEITYILLHFAAKCKDLTKRTYKRPNFLIVCATGVATAELLASRIKANFIFDKIEIAAKHQLDEISYINKFDLIISTVPLDIDKPSIVVNPLITPTDLRNIRERLFTLSPHFIQTFHTDNYNLSQTAKIIKNLIEKFPSKEDETILVSEIKRITDEFINNSKNDSKNRRQIMLNELLLKENIKLNVDCLDWEDVVRKSGDLLIKSGAITSQYVDEVINNVKEVGPYIVITKGVALPHATNKVGVNKSALSLITLKKPVNFGNKNNDPVKVSIMLAAIDSNSHLHALADLSEFLGREEFMNILQNTKDIDEILEYIKKHETKSL